jgi:hypothetical protein
MRHSGGSAGQAKGLLPNQPGDKIGMLVQALTFADGHAEPSTD